jgi:hypothetical protein
VFTGCPGPGEPAPALAVALRPPARDAAVRPGVNPPTNGCCTPGGGQACADRAIQACVIEVDALCESAWDEACVAAAIVSCEARCR